MVTTTTASYPDCQQQAPRRHAQSASLGTRSAGSRDRLRLAELTDEERRDSDEQRNSSEEATYLLEMSRDIAAWARRDLNPHILSDTGT